jgi:hypothetical protein
VHNALFGLFSKDRRTGKRQTEQKERMNRKWNNLKKEGMEGKNK